MRPLSQAMPAALAELLRNAPVSKGKIEFAWKAVVGPALERVTAVHLDGHTLFVDADTTQWAREVGRSTPIILRRLKLLLGDDTVTGIRDPGAIGAIKLLLKADRGQ